MSCWASLNWRRSWLTSWVEVPLPVAMRLRRPPSMRAGSARSLPSWMDDGLDLGELTIVDALLRLLELLGYAGQQRQDATKRTELLHLLQLGEKVLEGEAPFEEALGPSLGPRRRPNSRSACSMRLMTSPMPRMRLAIRSGWNWSIGQAFTGGAEGDGATDDLLHAQGGTAACVAVELGEDDPVEIEGLWNASAVATASCRSWRR